MPSSNKFLTKIEKVINCRTRKLYNGKILVGTRVSLKEGN
jgi:hypothetical protein